MFIYRKFLNTRSKRAFGLLGLALSLGATGALVTQNSSQNIARNTSSNATTRTSLLKRDNQGLKSTKMECDAPFGRAIGLGTCRGVPEPGPTGVEKGAIKEIGALNRRINRQEERFDRLETRLDNIESKLADLESIKQSSAESSAYLKEITNILRKNKN